MRYTLFTSAALATVASAASISPNILSRDLFSCAKDCLDTGKIKDSCDISSSSDITSLLSADASDPLVQCICGAVDTSSDTLLNCMDDCGVKGIFETFMKKCDNSTTSSTTSKDDDAATVPAASALLVAGGLFAALVL